MTDMNDKMDNDVSTKIAVDIILDEDDIVVQPGITQPITFGSNGRFQYLARIL